MKNRSAFIRVHPRLKHLLLMFASLLGATTPYRVAVTGYRYEFPRDHFNHPDFQTEWWYYTGNLHTADGRRFGFELTFFREAVSRDLTKVAAWEVQDLYLAHLALSDLSGGQVFHAGSITRFSAR